MNLTAKIIIVLLGLIIVADGFLASTDRQTFSQLALEIAENEEILPCIFGILMAHLFIPSKKRVKGGISALIIGLTVGLYVIFREKLDIEPLWCLLVGGGIGYFGWPQKRK